MQLGQAIGGKRGEGDKGGSRKRKKDGDEQEGGVAQGTAHEQKGKGGKEGRVEKSKSKKKKKKNRSGQEASEGQAEGNGQGLGNLVAIRDNHDGSKTTEQYLLDNEIVMSTVYAPVTSFDSLASVPLALPKRLVKAFQALQFTTPSPIQAVSWSPSCQGKDLIGIAETGSGKTLAFALPLLKHLLRDSSLGPSRALVLSPTRELASQTQTVLEPLAARLKLKSICIYGGVSKHGQIQDLAFEGSTVIVGTPGRVLDLSNQGHLVLGHVSFVVLDEADRMLDKGFENDIRSILQACAKERQTLLFSATWPESVRRLASTFLKSDPVRITIGGSELSANSRVSQQVLVMEPRAKDAKLIEILRKHTGRRAAKILVFALYKKEASRIEATLKRNGFSVAALHGDLSQDLRTRALDSFRTGQTTILVATDVAARGLDIPDVQLVLNVTFPLTTEDYVHRIGRTGRGGKQGQSITFFTENEKHLAGELARVLRESQIEVPAELSAMGTTIKKKVHAVYGNHFKEVDEHAPKAKKITFDDSD